MSDTNRFWQKMNKDTSAGTYNVGMTTMRYTPQFVMGEHGEKMRCNQVSAIVKEMRDAAVRLLDRFSSAVLHHDC